MTIRVSHVGEAIVEQTPWVAGSSRTGSNAARHELESWTWSFACPPSAESTEIVSSPVKVGAGLRAVPVPRRVLGGQPTDRSSKAGRVSIEGMPDGCEMDAVAFW
jgi:hypothetical protein